MSELSQSSEVTSGLKSGCSGGSRLPTSKRKWQERDPNIFQGNPECISPLLDKGQSVVNATLMLWLGTQLQNYQSKAYCLQKGIKNMVKHLKFILHRERGRCSK